MLSFLNNKYKNLGNKTFLTQASLLCLLCDITNIVYLNLYWLKENINEQTMAASFAVQGVDINSIAKSDLAAYKHLLIDALGVMFTVFLLYHLVVYFKMARNKLWAKKYVYGYALTGSVLTLFEVPGLFKEHIIWALIMLATTLIYIYTFMGIRYFKKREKVVAARKKVRTKRQ